MFVGHLAVAFAGKRYQPSLSLGWYVAAAIFVDMLWPAFLLLGIEHVTLAHSTPFQGLTFDSYPWSHSLVMGFVWALALGGLARWRGATPAAVWLVGALVLSHWVLDVVTHAPDMPLWPGASSPKVGLGLWNSIPATFAVEGAMWIGALALYLRGRRAVDRIGPVALWSLVALATVTWALGPWSPPPPTVQALGWFGLFGSVMVPWAAWADRHFRPVA